MTEKTAENANASMPENIVDRPLVSIITPTYNSADFIEETISSVMKQEYQNWEHIIVDDASTDGTALAVNELISQDSRIKFIQLETNSGAAIARNTAISAAAGRYIAFLDADDLWLPAKLSVQIEYMLRTGASFTFSSYGLIDGSGDKIGSVEVPKKATYNSLLRNNWIGCLTAVYDTEQIGKIKMPLIRKRQDLGLWLRILKQIPQAEGLKETLAMYRVRPGSISHNKVDAARYTWQLYRHVEALPFLYAVYYFSCYALNGLFKTRHKPFRPDLA
ncbi:glycosyltransferase family 2 protein [Parasphingorhabdus sp.]|uniref:glycosyltransferase family 2 protein n=1 Tax=Parasphingorhabdus sp. TaxID=2709688 RepID=UPI0032666D1B